MTLRTFTTELTRASLEMKEWIAEVVHSQIGQPIHLTMVGMLSPFSLFASDTQIIAKRSKTV